MTELTRDDIRAAVGAGMISEAQAASLVARTQARRSGRGHMASLDEPFELFRGFNELFIRTRERSGRAVRTVSRFPRNIHCRRFNHTRHRMV